ncbi:MAG TPA: SH3 domain-containing protein [Burkholderiales bacterium]|nr:SH3 domain-containing protein [Burkholderiales bacterium]
MYRTPLVATILSLSACAVAPPPPATPPRAVEPQVQVVRDPALDHRLGQLELQLMERDALIESLNTRLDEAQQEVVSVMAKLQSLATRAEAASAMAEADVALQAIGGPGHDSPESRQAFRLNQQSTAEFKRKNFGGALYLANQAKAMARTHGLVARLGKLRPGEVPFAVPVRLYAGTRANVRSGPGTNFAVVFTAEPGGVLSGLSYLGDWIRASNDNGSEGWILRSLVVRRPEAQP